MNLSNYRANAGALFIASAVALLSVSAAPAMAQLQQPSASARAALTFTSRTGGLLRVLTIRNENAGRISGSITQPNAVFQLRGRRDNSDAADNGSGQSRYFGTIATDDAPGVTQNFELRRNGNLAIFSFLRPGSETQTDLSTRTVFRPSAVNAAQQDDYAEGENYNGGFNDGNTFNGNGGFGGRDDAFATDDSEFVGTFRGSRSTLTLREGNEARTYVGTLRQGNRSFPVTVRRMPRLVGSYLDNAGRRRTFNAMSPGQDRLVIDMDGETESLRRQNSGNTTGGFDEDFGYSGNRRNGNPDFADTPAYEDDENSITPRRGSATPQDRYMEPRGLNGRGGGSRTGTGNRRENDDILESDGSFPATLPQRGRSTAPLSGRPVVQPSQRYSNRPNVNRQTSSVASDSRTRTGSDGKPLGRYVN